MAKFLCHDMMICHDMRFISDLSLHEEVIRDSLTNVW